MSRLTRKLRKVLRFGMTHGNSELIESEPLPSSCIYSHINKVHYIDFNDHLA